MTTVAVIGAGRMGSAMARALARAAVDLVVQNRTRERADELARELGARAVGTPAEAAGLADICLTMVADDSAVTAVYGADDGLLAGARDGSILVDLSTVMPDTIRAIAPHAAAVGAAVLDAPVSGSTSTAESGQLTLMVGGDPDVLDRAWPALEPLAKSIVHVGPLGAGAAMKLAVNTVIFGLNGALSEAIVLAEAAGVDRSVAYDVIAQSAAGAPFVGYKRASFLEPDATPVAFALELAAKDLKLIAALADSVGVAMPQSATNLAMIREAEGTVERGADFSAVAVHLRRQSAN